MPSGLRRVQRSSGITLDGAKGQPAGLRGLAAHAVQVAKGLRERDAPRRASALGIAEAGELTAREPAPYGVLMDAA